MFWYIILGAIIFGVIMGARESIQYAAAGHSVEDSRWIGVFATVMFSIAAGTVLAILYGLAWAVWAYSTWALAS